MCEIAGSMERNRAGMQRIKYEAYIRKRSPVCPIRSSWRKLELGEMFVVCKLVLEGLSSSRERFDPREIPFAVYQSSPLRMKLETSNTNIHHSEWSSVKTKVNLFVK